MPLVICMQPQIDEGAVAGGNKVMVFAWLDDNDVTGHGFLLHAVDFDPSFALKQAEDLVIDLNMGPVFIVSDGVGGMKGEATVIELLPRDQSCQKMLICWGLGEVTDSHALHKFIVPLLGLS